MIIGRKPILEALNSSAQIEHIYISSSAKGSVVDRIRTLARHQNIEISELPKKKIDSMAKGENTQGIIAVRTSVQYYSINNLLNKIKTQSDPLLLILDSIQDPHNLGAILRTAEAAGVNGVILSEHNSAGITETVEKVSAGAVSHLKIVKVSNLVNVIRLLKKNRFWVFGSSLEGGKNYTELDYNRHVAIIVGNEQKGIRRIVARNCDELFKIPMLGKIQSLNVSVASGIILYEAVRQRTMLTKQTN